MHHSTWAGLDVEQQAFVELLIADACGLAAAGASAPGIAPALSGLEMLGGGTIRVPWTELTANAPTAAVALSTLIHAWDFDDTHDEAVVHTASIVVPSVVAAALASDRTSGTDLLDGIVTGVQVLSRLARLVGARPGVIRTAGLGSFGAAAAAARAWRLDDRQLENALALSLVGALAPTTRQAVVDSSIAKRLQPGLAAQTGVTAAAMAAQGVAGPAGWLSGRFGLLPDSGLELSDLFDGAFEGDGLALKPYPACRYGHAAIAAAEQLHDREPDVTRVGSITVHLPAGDSYSLVSRPFADRGEPIIDAQFSVPWQVAAVWATGRYDLRTLAGPDLHRADVVELARRVEVVQDLPARSGMAGASVVLTTTDGRRVEAEAPMPGSPAHPLDRETVARKVQTCFDVSGTGQPADDVWDFVAALPFLDPAGLRQAIDRLSPAPARQPSTV